MKVWIDTELANWGKVQDLRVVNLTRLLEQEDDPEPYGEWNYISFLDKASDKEIIDFAIKHGERVSPEEPDSSIKPRKKFQMVVWIDTQTAAWSNKVQYLRAVDLTRLVEQDDDPELYDEWSYVAFLEEASDKEIIDFAINYGERVFPEELGI